MHQTGRFSADETGLTCVNIGPPHDVTAPFLSVAGQHDLHTQWALAGHSGVCLTTDVLGRRGRLRSAKGRLEAITTIILCIARRSSSGQPPLCANTVYKRGMSRTCPSSSATRQVKGDYSAHTGRITLRQIELRRRQQDRDVSSLCRTRCLGQQTLSNTLPHISRT